MNLLNLVILLKNRIITEYFVCIYGVLSLLCCKYICYGFLPFVCIFLFLALYIYELKTMSYRRQQLLHRASSTHSPCVSSPCVNLN